MRTYTLVVSILVHAAVIGTLIVAPLVATDVLPDPPRATTFLIVKPELVPTLPRAATRTPSPAPDLAAVPIVAPDGVEPETVVEPVGDPAEAVPRGDFGNDDPPSSASVVSPSAPAEPVLAVVFPHHCTDRRAH